MQFSILDYLIILKRSRTRQQFIATRVTIQENEQHVQKNLIQK